MHVHMSVANRERNLERPSLILNWNLAANHERIRSVLSQYIYIYIFEIDIDK